MNPLAAYITITINLLIVAVCVAQVIEGRKMTLPASAGEARRAETGTGSVYEHATSHSEGTPPSDPVGAKE